MAWVPNIERAMTVLFESVADLYSHEARHFIFMNVPPLNRTPEGQFKESWFSALTAGQYHDFEPQVTKWNSALTQHVRAFRLRHADVHATIYDANAFFHKVLDNPTEYGFDDDKCVSGERCMWFDTFHPDSQFHLQLARNFVRHFELNRISGINEGI